MRRTSLVAGSVGLLAIAAAGTLRFAVVPAQAQLPADTDTTRSYEGAISVMLDAAALARGDLANVIVRDVPITIQRTTAVTGVAEGNATIAESSVVQAPDGSTILGSDVTYVVDRKTMLAQGDRSGLVMGWPIGTQARDYTGWSSDLQAEVDLTYVGTTQVDGIDAYVFSSDITGQIVDPVTLANFPAALPKAVLPMVAGVLDVSDEVSAALPTLLGSLPDQVTLGYWLSSSTTYLVDPATGMVLDLDRTESRAVAFDVEGVPATPIADVFSMSYTGTEASVAATIADAKDAGAQLALFGTTLPLALALFGVVLLGLAAVQGRRPQEDVVIDITSAEQKVTAGV